MEDNSQNPSARSASEALSKMKEDRQRRVTQASKPHISPKENRPNNSNKNNNGDSGCAVVLVILFAFSIFFAIGFYILSMF